MRNSRTLLVSVIGSHIWKMDRPESDLDLFGVYMLDTRDVLYGVVGKSVNSKINKDGKALDIAEHEVGRTVEQLLKGNINFILGLHSPIVEMTCPDIEKLKGMSSCYITTKVMDSILGMARSNIEKYGKMEDGNSPRWSKINRLMTFSETLLKSGVLSFEPSPRVTLDELITHVDLVKSIIPNSVLPECPSDEDTSKLHDWLVSLRMAHYKEIYDKRSWEYGQD